MSEVLAGAFGLTYENDPFLQVSYSSPPRMAERHINPQNKSKMVVFANENEKLNHEKVEDKEPTLLPLGLVEWMLVTPAIWRWISRVKEGFLGSDSGKVKMIW